MTIHRKTQQAKWYLALADLAALLFAFGLGLLLLVWLRDQRLGIGGFASWWILEGIQQAQAFALLALIVVLFFWWDGHYSMRLTFWEELLGIFKGVALASLLNGMVVLFAKWPVSRFLWPVSWGLVLMLLPLFRLQMKKCLLRLGIWTLPTVIIGVGKNAIDAYRAMKSEPLLGFDVQCFVSVLQVESGQQPIEVSEGTFLPVQSLLPNSLAVWLEAHGCPNVAIAVSEIELYELKNQIELLSLSYRFIHIIPPLAGLPLFGLRASHFFSHEVLLLHVRNNLAIRPLMVIKRIFDFCGALLGLLFLSPLLGYIAIQIKRQGGALFFSHLRVGLNGKPFNCWKFRTMVHNAKEQLEQLLLTNSEARAEWERDFKLKHDPRITPIGAFLRKTSLDEIPQLWNVLKGEMSLVGPRPIVQAELERYGNQVHFYLKARPGITGLWQVSGRNDTTYGERVALDAWYVKNWNLWYDIAIICKTIRSVLKGYGAY